MFPFTVPGYFYDNMACFMIPDPPCRPMLDPTKIPDSIKLLYAGMSTVTGRYNFQFMPIESDIPSFPVEKYWQFENDYFILKLANCPYTFCFAVPLVEEGENGEDFCPPIDCFVTDTPPELIVKRMTSLTFLNYSVTHTNVQ